MHYVIPKPEDGTELSQDEILDALGAEEGLGWINTLRCKPEVTQGECAYDNVEWSGVELAFEEWDYQHQGLTEGAAALLSIAVAIATNGMGGELIGALTSTTTSAATTAISTGQYMLTQSLNAGITTLANQASMTLFSTGFDIGETLNELGSSENVHQLLDSMLTAAVVPQNDVSFFDGDDLGFWQQTANALVDATVDAGLTAIVQGAVYGYTDEEYLASFQRAVAANSIRYLGEQLATGIGDAAETGNWELGYQLMAHAAAGCLGGALSADNNDADGENGCASGTMGSVIGEMMGKLKTISISNDKESLETEAAIHEFYLGLDELVKQGADITKLSAAVSAFVFGLDPSIASDYASIAYIFNATSKLHRAARSNQSRAISYEDAVEKAIQTSHSIRANGEGDFVSGENIGAPIILNEPWFIGDYYYSYPDGLEWDGAGAGYCAGVGTGVPGYWVSAVSEGTVALVVNVADGNSFNASSYALSIAGPDWLNLPQYFSQPIYATFEATGETYKYQVNQYGNVTCEVYSGSSFSCH